MQKWHLPPAIGTGRPPPLNLQARSSVFLCSRHFLTFPACQAAEKSRDAESQGSTHGPSSRAKRRAEASADVQNLYRRSTAASNSTPKGIDARSLAAGPTGQTLERALNGGIDARSLAASPPPDAPRFTIRRSLGRQPIEGQQEERPTQNQPQRTRGLGGQEDSREEGSRQFTNRRSDDRRRPFENAGESVSTSRSFGRRDARSASDPRGGEGQRAGKGQNRGERMDRRNGNQNRNRTFAGRRGDRASAEELKAHEEEMEAYMEERREMLAPKPVTFEPTVAAQRENFEGVGPAIVSGVAGMKEILGEKMEQARWFAEGRQWIEGRGAWENAKQRREVLGVTERLEAGEGGQDQLLTGLFSGGYIAQHPALTLKEAGKQDTLTQVGRLTARNESYELYDEKGLFEKVKSLVAATPPPSRRSGGNRGTRESVKA